MLITGNYLTEVFYLLVVFISSCLCLTKIWKTLIWTVCLVVGGSGLENGWCELQHVRCLLNISIHQHSLAQGIIDFQVCCKSDTWESWQTFRLCRENISGSLWFPIARVFSTLADIPTETPPAWWDIKTIFWKELVQEIGKWITGTFGYTECTSEEVILQNKLPNN